MEWNALDELVATVRAQSVVAPRNGVQVLLPGQAFAYTTQYIYDQSGRRTRVRVENRDGNTPELGAWIETSTQVDILGQPVTITQQADTSHSITTQLRYTRLAKSTLA